MKIILDDDVTASLRQLAKRRDLRLTEIANLALRARIRTLTTPAKKRPRFQTHAVDLGEWRTANLDNIAEVIAKGERRHFEIILRLQSGLA